VIIPRAFTCQTAGSSGVHDQGAARQAQQHRGHFSHGQGFLEDQPAQQRRESRRAVAQHRADRRAVQHHGDGPQRIEQRQHETIRDQVREMWSGALQHARFESKKYDQQDQRHKDLAPESQNQGRKLIVNVQVADKNGGQG
jgi:hypothetical protein